jgi:ketosteroid isomerase-like protein
MASANLNVVRSLYAEWEGGDYSSVEWAHPEVEFVIVDGPSPGTWRGLAAMAEPWRDFLSAWEDVSLVADEYRELDGERILVLVRRSGRGKRSGLEIAQIRGQEAHVIDMRDGQVIWLAQYFDRDRALADLGLAPQADAP